METFILKPILFLDIDNVICFDNNWCDESMSVLNYILDSTNSYVVVISDRRNRGTTEDLQDLLNKYGFTGKVIGKTKNSTPGPIDAMHLERDRAIEIEEFRKENNIDSNYAIVDDMNLYNDENVAGTGVDERFVLVDFDIGIKEPGKCEIIIELLNK